MTRASDVEAAILERLTPTRDEADRMRHTVARLEAAVAAALAAAGSNAEASVQGSIAKGTWIAGSTDVDLFLLCDPDTPADELEGLATQVGSAVLESWDKKYAQHPYILGLFEGVQVDLVPAFRVRDASQRASAVDRTPLHTAWVKANLNDHQLGDVRLLKQWLKGVGAYGAETAVGGFSGYLCEVLVEWHASFDGVLSWLVAGTPRRHGWIGEPPNEPGALLVADPVDASRNVAAAVTEDTFARAAHAARSYRESPSEVYFFPPPPEASAPAELRSALASTGHAWAGLVLVPQTDRLDLILPQFQKAGRQATQQLTRAGFTVERHQVDVLDDGRVALQWLAHPAALPPSFERVGPLAGKEPNASAFRRKWEGHPDAVGPVREEGDNLVVTVARRQRTAAAWLEANQSIVFVGKHVRAALRQGPAFVADPGDAVAAWAPIVTEFILDRRPWQR